MEIQFNCPQCGLAMAASVDSREASVECPQCSTQFLVEAQLPQVPVVQARALSAPATPVASHGHGHGQHAQHGRGPAAPSHHPQGRRPAPPPHIQAAAAAARAAEREAAKQNKMLFIGLGGAAVLLVAVVVSINMMGKKVEEAPPPAHIAAPAIPKAAPPDPEQLKKEEELRKREEALALNEKLEKQRRDEEAAKVQAVRDEARTQYQEEQQAMLSFLAENSFDGDEKAAEAYMKVHQDVLQGVANLMEDGDPSNDIKTREDYEAYVVGRLVYWFEKNEVLKGWMAKHQRDTRKFVMELLQVEPKRAGSGSSKAPANKFDFTKYNSSGSGFWISSDGWILTNEHVVTDAKVVDLRLLDGKIVQAKVVKTDEENDLALLKADMAAPVWLSVSKGASDLTLGRKVFTVGYPDPRVQGVEAKFTDGRISAASGIGDRKDSYQTTVPVQHGNSGGALVDFDTGWVVGVINAKLESRSGVSADNVSYAIKGRVVSTFFESVSEAKSAAAKVQPKPVAKGDEGAVIERAKQSSVLILRPR